MFDRRGTKPAAAPSSMYEKKLAPCNIDDGVTVDSGCGHFFRLVNMYMHMDMGMYISYNNYIC